MIQVLFLLFFMCSMPIIHASVDNQGIAQESADQRVAAQHQAVHTLLNSTYCQNKDIHILTDHEWQELECDLLVNKIDRTKTACGSWGLNVLAHPISDLSIIAQRQARVKTIADNPLMRLELIKTLQLIKEHQSELLSYWDPKDDLNKDAVDLYYHMFGEFSAGVDKHLNRNRAALESASVFYVAKSVIGMVASLGLSGVINECVSSAFEKKPLNIWQGIKKGIAHPFARNSIYPDVFKDGYNAGLSHRALTAGTAGDCYVSLHEGAGLRPIYAKLWTGMYIGMENALFVYNVRQYTIELKKLFNITNKLHARMTNIARLFTAIERLRIILVEHKAVFGKDTIDQLDLMSVSARIQQLAELLDTDTFNQSGSMLYYRGRVLLAHQLLCDIKEDLIPALQQIGFVDAYCSVAQLYNDQSSQAPLCFAQFIESESPTLELERFWTPLLPTAKPVLNDIEWNEVTHNKIVLTGPSGAGKSTIMKSVAHNVLMAQAFGVAPAHKAQLKPFTALRSSLSPREDLQQNLSTFMAEKLRIDQTRLFIKTHKSDDCFLVLLDEPYRGTVEVESNYRVCELGKELAPMDHCMLIIATHLQGPTDLEQQTGVFSNYQLRLDDEQGKFTRTFELIPGAALWWFNDADKRRRFVDQLLDQVIV